jgi:hypothetical protein
MAERRGDRYADGRGRVATVEEAPRSRRGGAGGEEQGGAARVPEHSRVCGIAVDLAWHCFAGCGLVGEEMFRKKIKVDWSFNTGLMGRPGRHIGLALIWTWTWAWTCLIQPHQALVSPATG